jgi:hypothetical protein
MDVSSSGYVVSLSVSHDVPQSSLYAGLSITSCGIFSWMILQRNMILRVGACLSTLFHFKYHVSKSVSRKFPSIRNVARRVRYIYIYIYIYDFDVFIRDMYLDALIYISRVCRTPHNCVCHGVLFCLCLSTRHVIKLLQRCCLPTHFHWTKRF